MEPFVLQNDIVRLSIPTRNDIPEIIKWCNDSQSISGLKLPSPYCEKEAEWFLANTVNPGWESGKELTFALRQTLNEGDGDKEPPAMGTMSIRSAAPPPKFEPGEVGYVTAPWARGLGLASAALRLVLAWAFSTDGFDLDVARWECLPGNAASWRVAWKCGFQFDGIWRPEDGGCHTIGNWYGSLKRGAPLEPTAPWPAGAPLESLEALEA